MRRFYGDDVVSTSPTLRALERVGGATRTEDRYREFVEEARERALLDFFEAASRTHHATLREVFRGGRTKNLVAARASCWREMRARGFGLEAIGRIWDRDHTTVLYSLGKAGGASISSTLEDDAARIARLEARVAAIEAKLGRMVRSLEKIFGRGI
jgi:chromosomal replication initiation ATPase DnaA